MSRPTFGVLLRLVIGWHFLYEGWVKLIAPSWSAAGYLQSATGPLSRFFHWMGSTDWLVRIVDPLNVWGLLLVALGLMLGIAVRPAALSGMALLLLYYLSYPPLFGPTSRAGRAQCPAESHAGVAGMSTN